MKTQKINLKTALKNKRAKFKQATRLLLIHTTLKGEEVKKGR